MNDHETKQLGLKIPAGLLLVLTIAVAATILWPTPEGQQNPVVLPPESDSFGYLGTYLDKPITWNGCETIRWQLNAEAGDADIAEETVLAVEDFSALSGFDFEFVGTTTQTFPDGVRAELPPVDLHIEVVSASESNVLTRVDIGRTDIKHTRGRIDAAVVVLDSAWIANLEPEEGSRSWANLVTHELGHVVGLAHTNNVEDLMHETWQAPALSAGDRAGLASLRSSGAC